MRILITGGLGFIGSNFVRYMADNAEISVVDALKYGSNENNLKGLGYKFVRGDICNYELMAELVNGVDAIVNFAAETHVDRSISNPYAFIESNLIGTYTILEAMRKVNRVNISEDNKYQLYIPGGCAHGFLVLSDAAEVMYKADNIYAPNYESGLI